ncbi:hypothetical protein CHS0354_023201 [Potamilus streckersoni]|uniref:Uncharacterized protein n=1 Tax=Potamilus streckersoni TaxID=2493646 RepID=A0AAE0VWX3_9BIVA|nr:hypothetical protein CHS0354_023201 [Potamilus streckersoni]
MDKLDRIWEIIWDDDFWFRNNSGVTWKTYEANEDGMYIPNTRDLNWAVFIGVLLLGVRYLYETYIVIPTARRLGVSQQKRIRRPTVNPVLENEFKTNKKPDHQMIEALSKQTDLSVRKIQIWFRLRRLQDAPSIMQKFREVSWHFLFYLTMFIYGLVILWNKPWFSQTKYCWINWPQQHVTSDLYWYYMIELGFYWALVFSLLTDHKRKDFTEMVTHHVATIVLLYFSWLFNFVRIGSLVLVVHDASDYWMAAAKMANYCKKQKLTDSLFGIFLIVWIVSRLGIFPFVCIYATLIQPYHYVMDRTCGCHFFFNFFLILLQVLHILWSVMIFRIVIGKLVKGQVEDVRSDSEDDSLETEEDKNNIKELNGTSIPEQNGTYHVIAQ